VKPGRPNNAPSVAPPGMKWCNYREHFAPLPAFVNNDSYCQDCRKEYNRLAYQRRKQKRKKAEIREQSIQAICDHCGAIMGIPGSGEWLCPECGKEWRAVVKVRIDRESSG
jgi:hypothetical protein